MATFDTLDVNMLRHEATMQACVARFEREGVQVALPEITLFELTKHPDRWESTVMRSLQHLARCSDAVVLTRAAKPLGLIEEATGSPTSTMVATTMTDGFRVLLRDVHVGNGTDLRAFRDVVDEYRATLDHERHAADSLRTMQSLKSTAGAELPRARVAAIGRDLAKGDRASFREFLCEVLRVGPQRDAHVRRGVSEAVADALLLAPSVSYLFALAFGAIALEWVFKGGVEGADAGRVANDVLDIEYVLAGLWTGRLISSDQGARARLGDLKVVGKQAWPTHTDWFDRAEAVSPEDALATFLAPYARPSAAL